MTDVKSRSRSPRRKTGSLAGKKVVVTGGGSGIGKAIAVAFAEQGADIVICGRRLDALAATKELTASVTGSIYAVQCDQASSDEVSAMITKAHGHLGRIDVLVNNAGLNIPDRQMDQLTVERWHNVIDVNLNGAYHVCHSVLPIMRAQKGGTIINIGSIAGIHSFKVSGVAYSASKHGMSALGRFINLEEAKNGIRCTNLHPGETATEILDKRPVPPPAEARAIMMQPEDVAEMCLTVVLLPSRCFVPEIVMTGITTIEGSV